MAHFFCVTNTSHVLNVYLWHNFVVTNNILNLVNFICDAHQVSQIIICITTDFVFVAYLHVTKTHYFWRTMYVTNTTLICDAYDCWSWQLICDAIMYYLWRGVMSQIMVVFVTRWLRHKLLFATRDFVTFVWRVYRVTNKYLWCIFDYLWRLCAPQKVITLVVGLPKLKLEKI